MTKTSPPSYQQLHEELERVLSALQSPTVQVDEAVQLYEQGLGLVKALKQHLTQAENKMKQLKLQSAD